MTAADDDHSSKALLLWKCHGGTTSATKADTKGLELLGRSANRKAVAYIL